MSLYDALTEKDALGAVRRACVIGNEVGSNMFPTRVAPRMNIRPTGTPFIRRFVGKGFVFVD